MHVDALGPVVGRGRRVRWIQILEPPRGPFPVGERGPMETRVGLARSPPTARGFGRRTPTTGPSPRSFKFLFARRPRLPSLSGIGRMRPCCSRSPQQSREFERQDADERGRRARASGSARPNPEHREARVSSERCASASARLAPRSCPRSADRSRADAFAMVVGRARRAFPPTVGGSKPCGHEVVARRAPASGRMANTRNVIRWSCPPASGYTCTSRPVPLRAVPRRAPSPNSPSNRPPVTPTTARSTRRARSSSRRPSPSLTAPPSRCPQRPGRSSAPRSA